MQLRLVIRMFSVLASENAENDPNDLCGIGDNARDFGTYHIRTLCVGALSSILSVKYVGELSCRI